MAHRAKIRGLMLLWLVACARAAGAQPAIADSVFTGYMRFYAGDREGAYAHFETLHANDPQNLAVWSGLLLLQDVRRDADPALQASFEQGIAEFLTNAEQRYSRSRADAEALFSLANGYAMRARHRFSRNRGMWARRATPRSRRATRTSTSVWPICDGPSGGSTRRSPW